MEPLNDIHLINTETDSLETFGGVSAVLEMINADRSEEWTDYDENDWQDGLEFTHYRLPIRNGVSLKSIPNI